MEERLIFRLVPQLRRMLLLSQTICPIEKSQLNLITAHFRTLRKRQLLLLSKLRQKHHKKRKSIDKKKRRLWSIHSPETLSIPMEEKPTLNQVPQLKKIPRKRSTCKLRSILRKLQIKLLSNLRRKVRKSKRR